MTKHLFLENIRSAHNVGAMFRTADGSGVTQLYLGGHTPAPIDRFGRVQGEIAKTSLSASESVAWEKVGAEETSAFLQGQKRDGFAIVALEQTSDSIPLADLALPEQVLYIVGNEVDGVSPDALAQCDTVVHLPMLGQKESLNVSTAAGILMYHGLV